MDVMTTLLISESHLSQCPAKFGSGHQMPHVFPSSDIHRKDTIQSSNLHQTSS